MQLQFDRPGGRIRWGHSSQLLGISPIGLLQCFVETAQAGKSSSEGDLRKRQVRFGDQPFREQNAACLRDNHWRHTHVFQKQPPQMAIREAQPLRQIFRRALIERAILNQPQRAIYGGGSSRPNRNVGRNLRPAAQTRPITRGERCGGVRKIFDIAAQRSPGRTNRPAENARGPHGGEKQAIEPGIPGTSRAITGIRVHKPSMAHCVQMHQRFSDMVGIRHKIKVQ